MSIYSVNIVTAFGRGETLALALKEHGFDVRVFDFTQSFPSEFHRGAGPFPVALKKFLPQQKDFLAQTHRLSRGLSFWLKSGPFDLAGPISKHQEERNEALQQLRLGGASGDFARDWLRRFLGQWTAPYNQESWDGFKPDSFPYLAELGRFNLEQELSQLSFKHIASNGSMYLRCQNLVDLQIVNSRITEIEVRGGHGQAGKAEQWIWCLSSQETETLNADVAADVFNRDVRQAEWRWVGFDLEFERGPWSGGFPEYVVLLGDECLPWAYANLGILVGLNQSRARLWMKIPAVACLQPAARNAWAGELCTLLNERLPMARFRVNPQTWSICPHSPVLESRAREWSRPNWRNWDWIAPETLPRLDWSARLEREAESFRRLIQWRNELIKKQGARSDTALHAP